MSLFLNMIISAAIFLAGPQWETITLYWSDFTPEERSAIVRSSDIPSHVRNYYYRTEAPADDQATIDVLNTVSTITPPWQKRAMFLHTFDRILNAAEGSLADKMGGYCVRIIQSDPEYVMYYLHENDTAKQRFVRYLANGFYRGGTVSFDEFKTSLNSKLRGNPDLGQTLKGLYDDVEFAVFELRHNN